MSTPPPSYAVRRGARRLLAALRAGALVTLLGLALWGSLPGSAPSAPRAVTAPRCGAPGSPEPVASAVIRTERGHVRQVSFERGWDVYSGREPGTLLAVCTEHGVRAVVQVSP